MKNKIRLTESQLYRVINESVTKIITEMYSNLVLDEPFTFKGHTFEVGTSKDEVFDYLRDFYVKKFPNEDPLRCVKPNMQDAHFVNPTQAPKTKPNGGGGGVPKPRKSKWSFSALDIAPGSVVYYRSARPVKEEIPFTVVDDYTIRSSNGQEYTPLEFVLNRRGDYYEENLYGYNGFQHFYVNVEDFPKLREIGKKWMSLQNYGRTFFEM